MKRGFRSIALERGSTVAAPESGVHLGVDAGATPTPVSLRLFRLTGTSVSVVSTLAPAQLLAVRAAAAGTPVQVVTTRPQFWSPLLPSSRGRAHPVGPTEEPMAPGGASLIIHDRPGQARGPQETNPWQCRIDVRTEWSPQEIGAFAYTDLAMFGAVQADRVRQIAASFRMPADQAERLAHLEPGTVALARRGSLRFVRLDPSHGELRLLDTTRATTPAVQRPIWR